MGVWVGGWVGVWMGGCVGGWVGVWVTAVQLNDCGHSLKNFLTSQST